MTSSAEFSGIICPSITITKDDGAEAVEEELARFDKALAARRAAEAERLAAEKAKLSAE